jgi:hypothetical protein
MAQPLAAANRLYVAKNSTRATVVLPFTSVLALEAAGEFDHWRLNRSSYTPRKH